MLLFWLGLVPTAQSTSFSHIPQNFLTMAHSIHFTAQSLSKLHIDVTYVKEYTFCKELYLHFSIFYKHLEWKYLCKRFVTLTY